MSYPITFIFIVSFLRLPPRLNSIGLPDGGGELNTALAGSVVSRFEYRLMTKYHSSSGGPDKNSHGCCDFSRGIRREHPQPAGICALLTVALDNLAEAIAFSKQYDESGCAESWPNPPKWAGILYDFLSSNLNVVNLLTMFDLS
jgi:hypothetical protein